MSVRSSLGEKPPAPDGPGSGTGSAPVMETGSEVCWDEYSFVNDDVIKDRIHVPARASSYRSNDSSADPLLFKALTYRLSNLSAESQSSTILV